MTIAFRVEKITKKPFKGQDGTMVDYWWITATRSVDEVSFTFGTKLLKYQEGGEYSANLIKTESSNGKVIWKEA